ARPETGLRRGALVGKRGAFQVTWGGGRGAAAGGVFALGLSPLRCFFASSPHVPEDLPPADVPDDLRGVIDPGPVPPVEPEVPVGPPEQQSGKKKLQACGDCPVPWGVDGIG